MTKGLSVKCTAKPPKTSNDAKPWQAIAHPKNEEIRETQEKIHNPPKNKSYRIQNKQGKFKITRTNKLTKSQKQTGKNIIGVSFVLFWFMQLFIICALSPWKERERKTRKSREKWRNVGKPRGKTCKSGQNWKKTNKLYILECEVFFWENQRKKTEKEKWTNKTAWNCHPKQNQGAICEAKKKPICLDSTRIHKTSAGKPSKQNPMKTWRQSAGFHPSKPTKAKLICFILLSSLKVVSVSNFVGNGSNLWMASCHWFTVLFFFKQGTCFGSHVSFGLGHWKTSFFTKRKNWQNGKPASKLGAETAAMSRRKYAEGIWVDLFCKSSFRTGPDQDCKFFAKESFVLLHFPHPPSKPILPATYAKYLERSACLSAWGGL